MIQPLPTTANQRQPSPALRFGISRPEKQREESRNSFQGLRRTLLESAQLLDLEDAAVSRDDRLRLLSECKVALMTMGVDLYEIEKAEREIESLRTTMGRGWWR